MRRRYRQRIKTVIGLVVVAVFILLWFHTNKDSSDLEELDKVAEDWKNVKWPSDSDVVKLPPKESIDTLTSDKISSLYHRYINSLQTSCQNIVRLGNAGEGGWDICDDDIYRPHSDNCLVYSFGIDNDFSFDRAVVERYGCVVHAYDPSMQDVDRNYGHNIHFHSVGLADAPLSQEVDGEKWRLDTFKSLRKQEGLLKRTVDILKLDIEDWEWIAIPEMIKSGMLDDVRQLVVELHLSIIRTDPGPVKYKIVLGVMKEIYDAGFRIFWTHRNLFCKFYSFQARLYRTGCHEVSFVKVKS